MAYKEKECEGSCPKCGSFKITYIDTDWYNDTEMNYCSCDDCNTEFTQYYAKVYCNTSWEEKENLNTKLLWD